MQIFSGMPQLENPAEQQSEVLCEIPCVSSRKIGSLYARIVRTVGALATLLEIARTPLVVSREGLHRVPLLLGVL